MAKLARVKTVEIWPLVLIHAQDTKHAGAVRLHVLAASLDRAENATGDPSRTHGRIARDTLREAAEGLGVKRSTFFTWLADARQAGILRGKGEILYMASQEKLSQIVLCNSIDEHKATIPAKLLFKKGWKSVVWAAYLKANHHHRTGYDNKMRPQYKGDVISSKTLEDITGIKPRQQRRLNGLVKRRRNIAITTTSGSYEMAKGLNEEAQRQGQSRHYFVFNDPQQQDPAGIKNYRRVIAHTLPARRTVSDKHAQIGACGRRKKIQNAIRKSLRLVIVCNYPNYHARPQQAGTLTEGFTSFERLYHETTKQAERAFSGYTSRHNQRRAGVWDAIGGLD